MATTELRRKWLKDVFRAIERNDDLSRMESLLHQGGINCKRSRGHSTQCLPLLYACRWLRPHIVQLIIGMGADVNATDDHEMTALHYAARNGWLQVAKTLVEKGAHLNSTTDEGATALIDACFDSKLDIIRLLLESGADPNIMLSCGCNALHYAIKACDIPVVELLLRGGADVNILCRFFSFGPITCLNLSWWDYANSIFPDSEQRRSYILQLCLEHGAYLHEEDYEFKWGGKIVEDFLRNSRLCALAIVNKFNLKDLPDLYMLGNKMAENLPKIERLKIAPTSDAFEDIEKTVTREITENGHCNPHKTKPVILKMLCVESLISRHRHVEEEEVPSHMVQ